MAHPRPSAMGEATFARWLADPGVDGAEKLAELERRDAAIPPPTITPAHRRLWNLWNAPPPANPDDGVWDEWVEPGNRGRLTHRATVMLCELFAVLP